VNQMPPCVPRASLASAPADRHAASSRRSMPPGKRTTIESPSAPMSARRLACSPARLPHSTQHGSIANALDQSLGEHLPIQWSRLSQPGSARTWQPRAAANVLTNRRFLDLRPKPACVCCSGDSLASAPPLHSASSPSGPSSMSSLRSRPAKGWSTRFAPRSAR